MAGRAKLISRGWMLGGMKVNKVQWNWTAGLGKAGAPKRSVKKKQRRGKTWARKFRVLCPKCGIQIRSQKLPGHIQREHPKASSDVGSNVVSRPRHGKNSTPAVKNVQIFQCPGCDFATRKYDTLLRHVGIEHQKAAATPDNRKHPRQCPTCGIIAVSFAELSRHMANAHLKDVSGTSIRKSKGPNRKKWKHGDGAPRPGR